MGTVISPDNSSTRRWMAWCPSWSGPCRSEGRGADPEVIRASVSSGRALLDAPRVKNQSVILRETLKEEWTWPEPLLDSGNTPTQKVDT